MGMAYGIIRVEKVKSAGVGAMRYHNDRMPGRHSNRDIDPGRTHLNRELVPHGSYQKEVRDRIDRYRESDRKVRKDAVVLVEGIVTASPEWFEGRDAVEVEAFFKDAFGFVSDFAGRENMVHFTIHMDETTPHAHFGFVPLKDGKLRWKSFFDGRDALRKFQDDFYREVSGPRGMDRGEVGSGHEHKSVAQFKRDGERELADVRAAIDVERERLERLQREADAIEVECRDGEAALAEARGAREAVESRVRRLEAAIRAVIGAVREVVDGLAHAAYYAASEFFGFGREGRAVDKVIEIEADEPERGIDELMDEVGEVSRAYGDSSDTRSRGDAEWQR